MTTKFTTICYQLKKYWSQLNMKWGNNTPEGLSNKDNRKNCVKKLHMRGRFWLAMYHYCWRSNTQNSETLSVKAPSRIVLTWCHLSVHSNLGPNKPIFITILYCTQQLYCLTRTSTCRRQEEYYKSDGLFNQGRIKCMQIYARFQTSATNNNISNTNIGS